MKPRESSVVRSWSTTFVAILMLAGGTPAADLSEQVLHNFKA
jgi:hypothetical protein